MKLFHDFAANFIQRKRRAAKKQFEVLERSLLVSYPKNRLKIKSIIQSSLMVKILNDL
jgi:hypothetical protein